MNGLMNKKYVLLVFVLLVNMKAWGSHSSGAELTYKSLGGNTYELTFSFYRDCKGVANPGGAKLTYNAFCQIPSLTYNAPGTIYFSYSSASCGFCAIDSFPESSLTVTDVTPVCPGIVTTCNGGTITGLQLLSYKKVLTLPFRCSDWNFIYGTAYRNSTITTINNPAGTPLWVRSTLNNVAAPGNSSPSFTPHVIYLCAGQQFCYTQGGVDADGDSLVYSLVSPLAGVDNSVVTYLPGYSYLKPFGNAVAVNLDSKTGTLCVTPSSQMVTILDVMVKEYRNGVLIGSVMRDFEFVVASCNNNSPSASGINGAPYSGNNTDSVCAGSQLCFSINGADPDAADTLSMSLTNAIAGAAFNVSNNQTPNPVGAFCWTPALADANNNPHNFTVQIQDNACPRAAVQYFTYSIYVKSCNLTAPPVASFQSSKPLFCTFDCISFQDQSTNNPTSWLWNFPGGTPASSTDQNPQNVCYPVAGQYDISLIVTNSGGSDTLKYLDFVTVYDAPPTPVITQSRDTLYCSIDPSYASYQWYYSSSPIPGATNSFYVASQSGNYNVAINDENGCMISVGVNVVLGVEAHTSGEFQFSISPNPVGNELVLGRDSEMNFGNLTLSVYTMLGTVVLADDQYEIHKRINCKQLPAGIYFIQLAGEKKRWVGRFVKE